MKKRILALGAIAMISATSMTAFADSSKNLNLDNTVSQVQPKAQLSTVNANNVNLRKTPGTSGAIVRKLHKGYRVLEYSVKPVTANGHTWQKVSYGNSVGWVSTKYLTSDGR